MVINFGGWFGWKYLSLFQENTKKKNPNINIQIIVPITLLYAECWTHNFTGGHVINEEYFSVISVPTFLVAGQCNVSGFPLKTINFLVSNVLGRHIGKVDWSFT